MLAASRHRDGPSPIAQLGLFARAAISSGTIVSRVGGSPVTGKELQQIFTAPAQRPDPPTWTRSPSARTFTWSCPRPAQPLPQPQLRPEPMVGRRVHPGRPATHRGRRRGHQRLRNQHRRRRLRHCLLQRIVTVPGSHHRRGRAPPRTASPPRRSLDTCLARLCKAGLKRTVTQRLRTSKPATELSSERIRRGQKLAVGAG